MTALVFVDTNVFLYARDPEEPAKRERALAWLEHLWRQQAGRTSVQVLSEYYVNATRKLGVDRDDAWDDVEALSAWSPLPIDAALLDAARRVERRHGLGWWDSLIVAAAQAQDCTILLTEDLQDGSVIGGVSVRSPFTLAVAEAPALYHPQPRSRPRHPARGRPRLQPA